MILRPVSESDSPIPVVLVVLDDRSEESFHVQWLGVRSQVAAYARRSLRNNADAEDLCQVVALRAFRGYARFRGESGFLTWVMTIAQREAARLAARRAQLAARELPIDEADPPASAASDDAQADRVAANDGAWLRHAIDIAVQSDELSTAEARVLRARLDAADLTWERIGGTLGLTANTCAVLHCRAVVKLRVALFCHHTDVLGGPAVIAVAALRARKDPVEPLTDAEAEIFRRIVLDRQSGSRPRNWQSLLRAACGKVMRHLAL